MYNAEQKSRFIKDFSTKISVRKNAKLVFDLFEPYEEEWGADLCTQELSRIQPVFDKLAGVREISRKAPRTILRRYVEWCRDNNVQGVTDAVMNLDISSLDNLKTQMIRNPRHLQAMLDVICEKESEQTSDNYFRAFYWLAYAGMKDEDILSVRVSDVDFTQMSISFGGVDYPIYREAIQAIRNCVELQAFRYKHPNYGADKDVWKSRVDGDILVRGIRSVPSVPIFRIELAKRLKAAREQGKTDLNTSYYKIWLSGVFYRMREDEIAGLPVDFRPFVDEKLGDFQYKTSGTNTSQEYMRNKLANSYLADYERWKQTIN